MESSVSGSKLQRPPTRQPSSKALSWVGERLRQKQHLSSLHEDSKSFDTPVLFMSSTCERQDVAGRVASQSSIAFPRFDVFIVKIPNFPASSRCLPTISRPLVSFLSIFGQSLFFTVQSRAAVGAQCTSCCCTARCLLPAMSSF